jgi:hypothetical protein
MFPVCSRSVVVKLPLCTAAMHSHPARVAWNVQLQFPGHSMGALARKAPGGLTMRSSTAELGG